MEKVFTVREIMKELRIGRTFQFHYREGNVLPVSKQFKITRNTATGEYFGVNDYGNIVNFNNYGEVVEKVSDIYKMSFAVFN